MAVEAQPDPAAATGGDGAASLRAANPALAVVLDPEGRIVEQGPHAALLAQGGVYARLVDRQVLRA